jgi:hypothetical protein
MCARKRFNILICKNYHNITKTTKSQTKILNFNDLFTAISWHVQHQMDTFYFLYFCLNVIVHRLFSRYYITYSNIIPQIQIVQSGSLVCAT